MMPGQEPRGPPPGPAGDARRGGSPGPRRTCWAPGTRVRADGPERARRTAGLNRPTSTTAPRDRTSTTAPRAFTRAGCCRVGMIGPWTPMRSSSGPDWPDSSRPPSWPTPGGGSSCSTRSPSAVPRRPGVLVARRAVPRRLPRAAPDGRPRLARARPAGLVRQSRPVRPAPRTTGRGAGPRPTCTSPRARSGRGCTSMGHRFFPVVGWAERGDGRAERSRQLGAALPHHLGHRARRRRAVRAPRARGASPRAG